MPSKGAARASDQLRSIPSVDQLLQHDGARALVDEHGRDLVTKTVRESIADLRDRLKGGGTAEVAPDAILDEVRRRIDAKRRTRLCRAINATGVILHTGLGRAVLPREAVDAIVSEQSGYSLLEVDRDSGD